jgi:hypothetical protein
MSMKHSVIVRDEMYGATLKLGGAPIELEDYATTGLAVVLIGPRGSGKTNGAQCIGEQLAGHGDYPGQGWVSVFIEPEDVLESMYGDAVKDPEELYHLLETRERKIIVVSARDAKEFVPYGRSLLEAADTFRKPVFVAVDEGQLFSSRRTKAGVAGKASWIINQFAQVGRKRALDFAITTDGFTGTLNRALFRHKNLTFVGCQEDPTAWSGLAPQFKGSKIEFSDLNALLPGEFIQISRRGMEKVKLPMSEALKKIAPKAKAVRRSLPSTFSQWSRAMEEVPTSSLKALTPDVVTLLAAVSGLPSQQYLTGQRALRDELESRG